MNLFNIDPHTIKILIDNGHGCNTPGMWEHYVVNWCGKRLWEEGADPAWIKTWYDMYFDYRRQYEGQAMFALREIKEIAK